MEIVVWEGFRFVHVTRRRPWWWRLWYLLRP
jgi:hypothetical protein